MTEVLRCAVRAPRHRRAGRFFAALFNALYERQVESLLGN